MPQKFRKWQVQKVIFFCQPVPFYNYPNRDNDPICYKVNYERYDYIYPLLDRKADSLNNFVFLGNMLHEKRDFRLLTRYIIHRNFQERSQSRFF